MDQYVSIFKNLLPSLFDLEKLITASSYIIGISLIFKGVMTLKQVGEHRTHMSPHHTLKEPMFYFLSGSFLLFLPTGIKVFLITTFGTDNIMSYSDINSANPFINSITSSADFTHTLVLIIQLIGLISFIKGWMIISKSGGQSGHQQGGFAKGVMHIFGGILALNVVQSLNIISNTLYGS
jgi:intracellular multiplication protein IcmC